jgi:hypothetical protein
VKLLITTGGLTVQQSTALISVEIKTGGLLVTARCYVGKW